MRGRSVCRGFTPAALTDPDTNVRLGTAYLSGPAGALQRRSVGAGGVQRRREPRRSLARERPGQPRDEFIDNIPFPETQNYVKRIIGTAEDYRVLYGAAAPGPRRDEPARVTTRRWPASAHVAEGRDGSPSRSSAR